MCIRDRYGDQDFLRHHDRYLLLRAEQSLRVHERVGQCAVHNFGDPALGHDDVRCRYCHVVRGAKVLSIGRYSKSADSALLLFQETEEISLFLPFLPLLFVL